MDKIYLKSEFNCSDNFPIHQYFQNYSELVTKTECRSSQKIEDEEAAIAEIMGVSKEDVSSLANTVTVEKLNCEGEIAPVDPPDTIRSFHKLPLAWPINEVSLNTLHTAKLKEQLGEKLTEYQQKLRQEFDVVIVKKGLSDSKELKPYEEVVITVRVYHPFNHAYEKRNSCTNCKYSHDIVLLGSNTVADLRDNILCNNDIGICKEATEANPEIQGLYGKAKQTYPSGFIFIDNVFYNDFRQENAIDYSEVICEWAKSKQIGTFETRNMDEIKLESLTPSIGYPYVYQHQGNCEHLIVFMDMRLTTKSDLLDPVEYPYHQSINRYMVQLCMMCNLTAAKWIVMNGDRLIHDTMYVCQECFISYNYVDGKKVGNFKAYPYFDRASVL